jgi:cellulose synthase/poly-beta-1,6-N-acetylglucosamine synthase-like glycosyltransferase
VGYPVSLICIVKLFAKKNNIDESYSPKVSVLIAAHNEERCIRETIMRLLGSDYDLERMEILVGSDNSTDSTDLIIKEISTKYPQVKLTVYTQRQGKAGIINELAKNASGEVLVFCDANTLYQNNAIRKMIQCYTDNTIGGVCGRLILNQIEKAEKSGSQESNYWNIETAIKILEGRIGILIGSNGGIYSLRKKYYVPIPKEYPVSDDFYLTMKVLEQEKKFIYVKDAIAEENVAPSVGVEYYRKVRTTSNNLSTIKPLKALLHPRYGLVAYGFWCHKILRWATPILLIITLLTNVLIFKESWVFEVTLILQAILYAFALLGYLLKLMGVRIVAFLLCTYFVLTNIALLKGIYQFFTSTKYLIWETTARE